MLIFLAPNSRNIYWTTSLLVWYIFRKECLTNALNTLACQSGFNNTLIVFPVSRKRRKLWNGNLLLSDLTLYRNQTDLSPATISLWTVACSHFMRGLSNWIRKFHVKLKMFGVIRVVKHSQPITLYTHRNWQNMSLASIDRQTMNFKSDQLWRDQQ